MNISPIGSMPMTIYTQPLQPVSAVQKVSGGASDRLLAASKNMEVYQDAGTTYSKDLREMDLSGQVGTNISIVV